MRRATEEARQMLLDRRRTLSRRYPVHQREEQALLREGESEPDPIDRAPEREEAGRLAQLSEVERVEISEIDAALDRIESGQYGSCERCGGAIGNNRLRALPETRLCLDCSAANKQRRLS